MDAVLLARLQFALTIMFHFIFPPLTIGTAWIIVWMMSKYRKSGDELYGRMARFWVKLFAITFAIGVATGITMEFQFGMNWSEYSAFVGDIFGAPLAAEAILAFFLESTFVGVLIFGWKKFSRNVLWFSSLMVAFGSTLSAFWIIVANSWQQTPAGFHIVGGRAELTSFSRAIFNPSTMPRFLHTLDATLITGAFFVMGISAWFLLKKRHEDMMKRSLKASLILAFITSLLAGGLGHWHAIQVAETQPAKLAALEGLFKTQKRAPLLVFGIPDQEAGKVHADVRIPAGLSILVSGNPDKEIKGLDAFPKDEWPPILLPFASFHTMVGLGTFFIAFTLLGLYLLFRKRLYETKWYLWGALLAIPLPIITNELGWMTAEVGRQPWIVQGLLKTKDAVSVTVPAWQLLISIIMFALIYLLLGLVWVHLLGQAVRKGPEEATIGKEA